MFLKVREGATRRPQSASVETPPAICRTSNSPRWGIDQREKAVPSESPQRAEVAPTTEGECVETRLGNCLRPGSGTEQVIDLINSVRKELARSIEKALFQFQHGAVLRLECIVG